MVNAKPIPVTLAEKEQEKSFTKINEKIEPGLKFESTRNKVE